MSCSTARCGAGCCGRARTWRLALGLLVFSPVLIWNAGHGWASFLFQGGRAVGGWTLRPDYLVVAILAQAAYLFPWIWGSLIVILIGECRNWRTISLGSRAALALPGGCSAGRLHGRRVFSPGLAALGLDRAGVALSDPGPQVGGDDSKSAPSRLAGCLPAAPAFP